MSIDPLTLAAIMGGTSFLNNMMGNKNASSYNDTQMKLYNDQMAAQEKLNAAQMAQQNQQFQQTMALQGGISSEAYSLNHGYIIPHNNLMTQLDEAEKAPYIVSGRMNLQRMDDLISGKARVEESPAFRYQLQRGADTVQAGQAARGGLLSGRGMKELGEYGMGFAGNEYDKQLARFYQFSRPTAIQQRQQFGLMSGGSEGSKGGTCPSGSHYERTEPGETTSNGIKVEFAGIEQCVKDKKDDPPPPDPTPGSGMTPDPGTCKPGQGWNPISGKCVGE